MSKRDKAKQSKAITEAKREPTDAEKKAIAQAKERRKDLPSRPSYSEEPSEDGTMALACPHSDTEGHPYLVADALATTSDDFVNRAMLQLANMTASMSPDGDKPNLEGLNGSLALIGAIGPENELEAALAVQMASTHELSCDLLRRAKHAKTVEGMRQYANEATKLSRTFTAQMKALSDWRRGGEQVVRHVHVYQGGQAVVAGTINTGGRNDGSKTYNVHGQYSEGSCGPEMLGYDPTRDQVPATGAKGEEPLLTPRRQDRGRRSTEGEP